MPDRAERFLDAMVAGIKAHASLLAVVLPRMSPEYVVVAAAAHGLVTALKYDRFEVLLEQPVPEHPRKKCDIVVRSSDGADTYFFELKPLWQLGFAANVKGISEDRGKLSRLPHGYAVAFAFALGKVPAGRERWLATETLEETMDKAVARIPELVWPAKREPFDIPAADSVARACLLAWKA